MTLSGLRVSEALDAIGSRTPVPGGGAVAALTAALAAATARMVVEYSRGKKSLAEHDTLHQESLVGLEAISQRCFDLADQDAEAYAKLNELWRLAEDDPRRQAEWDGAVEAAIAAPSRTLDTALEVLEIAGRLLGRSNPMLRSDLAIAAILGDSAARSAAWNVRINLPQVTDRGKAESIEAEVASRLREAATLCRQVEAGCEPA